MVYSNFFTILEVCTYVRRFVVEISWVGPLSNRIVSFLTSTYVFRYYACTYVCVVAWILFCAIGLVFFYCMSGVIEQVLRINSWSLLMLTEEDFYYDSAIKIIGMYL